MKAAQCTEYGGPEVLKVVETDEPHPGPGQVRITVRAAGLNLSDLLKVRTGVWKGQPVPLPTGVGVEGAGLVDEIGEGVTNVAVGDAVLGYGLAMVADRAVLRPGCWVRKPKGLSFEEAAGLPVAVETATRLLSELNLAPGQTLLVSGASGSIGSMVVQIALHRGLVVIGTASPGKQEALRLWGALPTTYGPGLAQRVRTLAPQGVDGALDVAGSGIIPELIELVGEPTRVVSAADFTATRFGARMSLVAQTNPERVLAEALDLRTRGILRVATPQVFPLAQVAEAYAVCAEGHSGKIVVALGGR